MTAAGKINHCGSEPRGGVASRCGLRIIEADIARRRELVRIAETAIALHRDRITGHQAAIATERAEIGRLEAHAATLRTLPQPSRTTAGEHAR